MDRILICGGNKLKGTIRIGGAKNAALPLLAASLLTDDTLTLAHLPHLVALTTLARLLGQLGVELEMNGHAPNGHAVLALSLTARRITDTTAPDELVRKRRASVLVL